MGYDWLPKALEALRGVQPSEVMQALGAARRLPVPGSAGGISVLSVWARTHAGRPIIVVLRHADGVDWLILGAREMDPDQRARFEQWEAQS
jgi:hypothetical protein